MHSIFPINRMCLAQKFIDEKTNEIPAAQELLKLMDLEGTIVTADAMNCQKDTVSTIVRGKGALGRGGEPALAAGLYIPG